MTCTTPISRVYNGCMNNSTYRGIIITRMARPFHTRTGTVNRLSWVFTTPFGESVPASTRKQAQNWIDDWFIKTVNVPQTDMKGNYFTVIVADGEFKQTSCTAEEWRNYWKAANA